MQQPEHPDSCLHQQQVGQITRGGRQAADSAAMEAYWQALDSGVGKEEAEKVFNDTYKKVLHDSRTSTGKGN